MRTVEEAEGIKTKTLSDEPVLSPHLLWVWKAFTDLNARRPVAGMGTLLPFSYVEIDAYCRLKDITHPYEKERLLNLLERLDRTWMAKYVADQTKETPSSTGPLAVPRHHNPPRGGGTKVPPRTKV